MIDLVKTHLTHPWGPPWTLETLGGPWRPLATLGDMLENDHFGGNWSFSSMSPRVAKGFQAPRGQHNLVKHSGIHVQPVITNTITPQR